MVRGGLAFLCGVASAVAVADPFLAYWDKFGRPARALEAKYMSPFPHGWWYDAEKAARIRLGD